MERNHSVLEEQIHYKIKHNFSFVVSLTYHSRFYHIVINTLKTNKRKDNTTLTMTTVQSLVLEC
jgi:hypothetical protein